MPKITFKYMDDFSFNVHDRVRPAKEYVPDWYRNLTPYIKGPENPDGKKLIVEDFHSNASAKKCVPMLDAITAGYIVPLWADVQVRQINGDPRITWKVQDDVFELHGSNSREIPAPPGYDSIVFKYNHKLWVQTEPGYSVSVLPPAGHYDLPFLQIPAVIDTDSKSMAPTPFPVWIKKGFEGIVEKGTPIAQIIPFKRESWTHDFDVADENEYTYSLNRWKTKIGSQYIKSSWHKKRYD
jgi:hypothetical protein